MNCPPQARQQGVETGLLQGETTGKRTINSTSINGSRCVSVAQWLEEPPTNRKVVGSRLTESVIGSRQEGHPD